MGGAQDDDDVVIHQRVIVQCVGEHAHARARMVDETVYGCVCQYARAGMRWWRGGTRARRSKMNDAFETRARERRGRERRHRARERARGVRARVRMVYDF